MNLDTIKAFLKKNTLAVCIFGGLFVVLVAAIVLIAVSLAGGTKPAGPGTASGDPSSQGASSSADASASDSSAANSSEPESGSSQGSNGSSQGGSQTGTSSQGSNTSSNGGSTTVTIPVSHDSRDNGTTPAVVLRTTAYEGYGQIVTECTVQNFGAKGDGKTDDTQAFQKALDYVNSKGGGTVFVPAGTYVLKGSLRVYRSCTLLGEWYNPDTDPGKIKDGTVLLAYTGKGSAGGTAFLNVANGSSVIGVTVYYPEQSASSPSAYSPTVRAVDAEGSNSSGYPTIKYTTLVNPWTGVSFGPAWNELGVMEYVYMTPLDTGLFVNMTTDISRVENLYIGAKYYGLYDKSVDDGKLKTYMKGNVTGIELQRSDWQYLYNCSIADVNIGIKFARQATGSISEVDSCNAQIYGLTIQNSTYGLYMENNKMSTQITKAAISTDKDSVVLKKNFTGTLALNTAELSSKSSSCVTVDSGSTGAISLMDSTLKSWKTGAYAVNAAAGGVLLDNVKATGSGTTVMLAKGTTGATINNCSGVTVKNNIGSLASVNTGSYKASDIVSKVPDLKGKAPSVKGSTLINVMDRGANNTGASDNTAIFQKALNDAAKTGGVVYVPGGTYLLNGTLTIPTGVELRGVSTTGHHSNAMGTVLYTTQGKGNANGTPFITVSSGAGVRGFTIWYPDQVSTAPVEYPYAISIKAKNAWVIDTTVGNGWQGLYLGAGSGGHYISYFSGFSFLHDIYLDGSDSRGYIVNCHFNPHFYGRTSTALKGGNLTNLSPLLSMADTTKQGSVVLGKATGEVLFNNFNYRGRFGLKVIGQDFDGILVGCGFDGVGTGVVIEGTKSQLTIINFLSDLVPADPHYMTMNGGNVLMVNSGFSAYNFVPSGGVTVMDGTLEMRQMCFGVSTSESSALAVADKATVTLAGGLFNHRGPVSNNDFTQQGEGTYTDILNMSDKFTLSTALAKWNLSVLGSVDTSRFKVYQ